MTEKDNHTCCKDTNPTEKDTSPTGNETTALQVAAVLMVLALGIAIFNGSQMHAMSPMTTEHATAPMQMAGGIIPTGIPDRYGDTLSVSYDDIDPNDPRRADAAIARLAQIDRSVELTGGDLERYINILYHHEGGMSCEYCCGARSIIFESGDMACGCAHSFAMRGLTKYLILEHPDLTDEEIFEEIGKWKVLFFPTQMQAKADVLEGQGIEPTYENIASNRFRGIEQGSGGGMVGGC